MGRRIVTDGTPFPELPDCLPGVAPERVADAADPGLADLDTERLLETEASFLRAWRGRDGVGDDAAQRTGLAFSGGGVRSAAFALGVLQVLAGRRLLERFDYLSSVSGGGFIAAAPVWLLGPEASGTFGTGPDDFPFGAEPRSGAPSATGAESDAGVTTGAARSTALLNFLRQHGAYLTPGHGITLTSAIAVVLRGILLNLLVWIPILVAVMLTLFAVSGLVGDEVTKSSGAPAAFDALAWIAAAFGALFVIGSLAWSFSTHSIWHVRRKRYLLHRAYEMRMPWLLWSLLGAATLASLPWAASASLDWIGKFGRAVSVGAGIGIGLWSLLRPDDSRGASFVRRRALPVGALSALYGVLLFACQSALRLYTDAELLARTIAAASLAVALSSGRLVNLNYISVQRYYRDRLMEVFTPDVDGALCQRGGPAGDADGQRLSACLDLARARGPYPLSNTHLPLGSALSRRRRLRGGDNFILSPLYCGSSATGWRRTTSFMDDGMTLPTAMAISGSVNHQQSGLGGVGIALDPPVSLLKLLLNLRMGYWVPNPHADDQSRRPHHFRPGLDEALAIGRDEEASFPLLEDGGHFDNLGLYELFRRHLGPILVCDAGADAGAWLSDLYRVLRLAEVDFGARVTFDDQDDYVAVIPGEDAAYPAGGRVAKRGHLTGRVDYADGAVGTLVYLKSALVPGLSFGELGFGSRRAGFPSGNHDRPVLRRGAVRRPPPSRLRAGAQDDRRDRSRATPARSGARRPLPGFRSRGEARRHASPDVRRRRRCPGSRTDRVLRRRRRSTAGRSCTTSDRTRSRSRSTGRPDSRPRRCRSG